MNDHILYRLTSWLWTGIVVFIVTLALYVSVGRFLMNNVAQVQAELLRELNARLNFVVEAGRIRGSWESLTPYLELTDVRVLGTAQQPVVFRVRDLRLGFDVLRSLRTASLQLYSLVASDVVLHADIDDEGKFSIPGIPRVDGVWIDQLLEFVLNTEHLSVDGFALSIRHRQREWHLFSDFQLLRDEQFRRLTMSLFSPGEESWFRILAEGRGNLLRPASFAADMHMGLRISEVDNYSDLGELAGIEVSRGSLESEVWLQARDGRLRTVANFSATDFAFTPPGEQAEPIVLEEVSAVLRVDGIDQDWKFAATDIRASGLRQAFLLEGISGNLQGPVLQFQVADIDVASLVNYAIAEKLLPGDSKDIFSALAPGGHLTRMRVNVSDIERWQTSWELQANFDELSIASWRGAPTIENGSGYLRLNRAGGMLQLDARDFAMGLPTFYEHVFEYQTFQSELVFAVEEDRFDLWSGQFFGMGEEGEVSGLFALTVPFEASVTGIEMDLLVGLENVHPRTRDKYLPYTLPAKLISWLDTSFGDGLITEGGFIYRGSLRRGLVPHRTVQLFFEVENGELRYHPDWPALDNLAATLYVDNTRANGFAREARLYDSTASDVSIKVAPNALGALTLVIEGHLQGPAGDGLSVVNNSPIRKFVGDTFSDWQLTGPLDTHLQFTLNLNDLSQAPRVDLEATLDGVSLHTGKLDLEVQSLAGTFNYRTDTGFSAADISGRLWGQSLTAKVSQGAGENGEGLNDLDIYVSGFVDSAAVRDWLGLDLLRLTRGGSDADLHIIVPPGGQPRLEVSSTLQGVALDLPQQFAKSPETARPLRLTMPLGPAPRELIMTMDEAVWLNLVLGTDGLQAAGLGFSRMQTADLAQGLVVGGELDRLDWTPWFAFAEEYVLGAEGSTSSDPAVSLKVSDLSIGEIHLSGQVLHDITLSAQRDGQSWNLDYSGAWVRGSAAFPEDLSEVALDVSYLDLAELPQPALTSPAEDGAGTTLDLPDMRVVIKDLRSGELKLGSVQFQVLQEQDGYHVRQISGDLRGLLLGGDEELSLNWQRGKNGSTTSLHGPVRFLNFGDVLVNYGYDEIIETNSGAFDMDLTWPGAPGDFALANTGGRMDVTIDDGRFLKSSAAAEGTLRVMGIFNLAEFVRRLSFDMNYLFKSGVPFDSISGELIFQRGQIEVPQMDVLGASSRFQFVGLVDVKDTAISGEMVATLPVASNLPWVAVLIGGLPAAAGVYVVSKVFTEQVDRFSSGVYSINGPWEDPEVKFQRIFDNTASHQQALAEADPNEVEPP